MRIAYFGDGAWAHQALDRILADSVFSVAFVAPRYDAPDPILCRQAERAGVDVLRLPDVNSDASLARIRSYDPDIVVSMSFNQIMKAPLLSACPMGAINCHAGALPFYRGRNVLNWALINDEPEFAVTVHYMDTGIDTGDVILQRSSPISDDDTYATLLDRAVDLCADTLHEALRLLVRGTAKRAHQSNIHPVGFYTGRRIDGDEWIDWAWPSRRVFNFVRAITTPGPCAKTMLDDVELAVVSAEMIPEAPVYVSTPGEIVGRTERGFQVKTGDSSILVTELNAPSDLKIRIGNRFDDPRDATIRALDRRVAALERQLAHLQP